LFKYEGDCKSQSSVGKKFSIKDLNSAKKILEMRISKEMKKTVEAITSRVHRDYAEKV